MKSLLALTALNLTLQCSSLAAVEFARVTDAQFRGCDAAGWCDFHIETPGDVRGIVVRVRPDGVALPSRDADRVALRNRLNALLVDMIHQYKSIELRHLREQEDGVHAAQVIVNDADVAGDRVVQELLSAAR